MNLLIIQIQILSSNIVGRQKICDSYFKILATIYPVHIVFVCLKLLLGNIITNIFYNVSLTTASCNLLFSI